jgi:hypothetical protein
LSRKDGTAAEEKDPTSEAFFHVASYLLNADERAGRIMKKILGSRNIVCRQV